MKLPTYWKLATPNTGKRLLIGQVLWLFEEFAPYSHQCSYLVTRDAVFIQAFDVNNIGKPADARIWTYQGSGLYLLKVAEPND